MSVKGATAHVCATLPAEQKGDRPNMYQGLPVQAEQRRPPPHTAASQPKHTNPTETQTHTARAQAQHTRTHTHKASTETKHTAHNNATTHTNTRTDTRHDGRHAHARTCIRPPRGGLPGVLRLPCTSAGTAFAHLFAVKRHPCGRASLQRDGAQATACMPDRLPRQQEGMHRCSCFAASFYASGASDRLVSRDRRAAGGSTASARRRRESHCSARVRLTLPQGYFSPLCL
jgi:hypothetical protein